MMSDLASNPFAFGFQVGQDQSSKADLQQALASRLMGMIANSNDVKTKAASDREQSIIQQTKAIGDLVGAGGWGRMLGELGTRLGPVVQDPNGYGNVRDRLSLDTMRAGALKDLMLGAKSGAEAGVMPTMEPGMMQRLGVPSVTQVTPLGVREAQTRGANSSGPKITVETAPGTLVDPNPRTTTKIQGRSVDEVQRAQDELRNKPSGSAPQGTTPTNPTVATPAQTEFLRRLGDESTAKGATITTAPNADGSIDVTIKAPDGRMLKKTIDPQGRITK